MSDTTSSRAEAAARLRAANRRVGLVLLSIALVFFVGIMAAQYLGGLSVGMTVLGSAVLLFLAVAIARNLRSKR